jgi:hypothetical protein
VQASTTHPGHHGIVANPATGMGVAQQAAGSLIQPVAASTTTVATIATMAATTMSKVHKTAIVPPNTNNSIVPSDVPELSVQGNKKARVNLIIIVAILKVTLFPFALHYGVVTFVLVIMLQKFA